MIFQTKKMFIYLLNAMNLLLYKPKIIKAIKDRTKLTYFVENMDTVY